MRKICERALSVTDDDLRAYQPREIDVRIAEAFLAGACTFAGAAEMIGVGPDTVSNVMTDGLPCAWVAQQVRRCIAQRLGLVDAAVLGRALGGSVEAAKLVYQRWEGMRDSQVQINVGQINYEQLSDADLDLVIAARRGKVLDVKKDVECGPAT